MLKAVCLLVFVTALAVLQNVQPCCLPKIFEGNLELTAVSPIAEPTFIQCQGYGARDTNRQMDYFKGNLSQNRIVATYETLVDYKNHIQYIVVNGTCKMTRMPQEMFTCIPKNASKIQTSYYGYDAKQVEIEVFDINEKLADARLTVMKNSCALLRMQILSLVYADYMFTGMKTGVTNQTIFNPPPSCKHVTIGNKQEAHFLKFHQHLPTFSPFN